MVRPGDSKRYYDFYFPTPEDKQEWQKEAQKYGLPLARYLLEMAEKGHEEEENRPRGISAQDLAKLREEVSRLREEIKLKDMMLEKQDTELFKQRYSSFLKPEHVSQISKELVDLLRQGGRWAGSEILTALKIDPRDSEAAKIVLKQLQVLQDFGLVQEGVSGWRWSS